MPRQEHGVADKAEELRQSGGDAEVEVVWGGELVIRGTQDRHVLVAKPQPELMSRRGMPASTNEGATSITVSQAQSARV